MKKKIMTISLSLMLLLTAGCGKIPKLENGEEVVAEVEGKQFTANDLYKALKEQGGTSVLVALIDDYIASKEFTDNDAAEAYAESQYKYMKQVYEAQGSDLDSLILSNGYKSVAAYKEAIKKDYIVTKIAEKFIGEELSDSEIKKYYDEEIFGAMTVRHILIQPEELDSDATDEDKKKAKEDALNEAKEIIKQIQDGADFATLAKEKSEDPGTASNGGLYESFLKETTDSAFWSAAYKLKDGEYTTTPVESAFGYHIILKISSEEKPSLEDSKDKIVEELVAEKTNKDSKLIAKTWAEIRKKYNLNIVETTIKDDYETTINSLKSAS